MIADKVSTPNAVEITKPINWMELAYKVGKGPIIEEIKSVVYGLYGVRYTSDMYRIINMIVNQM